jgi:predicted aspartyl protease
MKAVISTLMVTIITGVIVFKFYLSSFFGFLGYAVLPIESLNSLTHSKKIVQKMQHRNKVKTANVSKRFIQRSGKKVAVTAVSAATIGTVAVIGTLTYLEISQYCEDKQQLNEEANILFDTKKQFDMNACLEQGKKDSAHFANEAWQSIKATSSSVLDSIEQTSDDLLDPSRKATVKLFESIDEWLNQKFY